MNIPFLDRMLTLAEAAEWLQVSERTLLKRVRVGKIRAARVNSRMLRFNPRTLIKDMES